MAVLDPQVRLKGVVPGPSSGRKPFPLWLRLETLLKICLSPYIHPDGRQRDPVSHGSFSFTSLVAFLLSSNFQGFGTAKVGKSRFFLRRI